MEKADGYLLSPMALATPRAKEKLISTVRSNEVASTSSHPHARLIYSALNSQLLFFDMCPASQFDVNQLSDIFAVLFVWKPITAGDKGDSACGGPPSCEVRNSQQAAPRRNPRGGTAP